MVLFVGYVCVCACYTSSCALHYFMLRFVLAFCSATSLKHVCLFARITSPVFLALSLGFVGVLLLLLEHAQVHA